MSNTETNLDRISAVMSKTALFMNPPFLRTFIEAYRSHPCLWKVKSADYNNKRVKEAALQELVTLTRHTIPDANIDFVRKKIDALRGCFRKEYKRVIATRMGITKHVPKLWYYSLLLFTVIENAHRKDKDSEVFVDCNQPNVKFEKSEFDFVGEESTVHTDNISDEESVAWETPPPHPDPLSQAQIIPPEEETQFQPYEEKHDNAIYDRSRKHQRTEEEDEHDLLGRIVAGKLRRMEETQRIHAEKLISDVLYMGLLKQLSTSTAVVTNRN